MKQCPKSALMLLPEYSLGASNRLNNVLSYTQMKEIEYSQQGEVKTIRYAEIGKENYERKRRIFPEVPALRSDRGHLSTPVLSDDIISRYVGGRVSAPKWSGRI